MYEIETNKNLDFLDMLLTRNHNSITTLMYVKSTNSQECLNYSSLFPTKHKIAVIKNFLHRSYSINSTWDLFHQDIQHIRQALCNNGYPMKIVDNQIKAFVTQKFETKTQSNLDQIVFYYQNQDTSHHRSEEQQLTAAVTKNVTPTRPNTFIRIITYYKNRKLRNLVIRNKMQNTEANDRVVYRYTCNEGSCNAADYIGYTVCSLAKRFYFHNQSGSICSHNKDVHNTKPGSRQLRENTQILYRGEGGGGRQKRSTNSRGHTHKGKQTYPK